MAKTKDKQAAIGNGKGFTTKGVNVFSVQKSVESLQSLSIKFAYFLEISYFKLEISCLYNEPKSLFRTQ